MDARRGLTRHGMTLFLAGLLTGLAVPLMLNPRAGVAGRLEGVVNGTFLVMLGCAWKELRLGACARRFVYPAVVFGAWANWCATILSAILGTSKATPISGAGHADTAVQEALVYGLFAAVAIAMVGAIGVSTWHLWRRGSAESPSAQPQP